MVSSGFSPIKKKPINCTISRKCWQRNSLMKCLGDWYTLCFWHFQRCFNCLQQDRSSISPLSFPICQSRRVMHIWGICTPAVPSVGRWPNTFCTARRLVDCSIWTCSSPGLAPGCRRSEWHLSYPASSPSTSLPEGQCWSMDTLLKSLQCMLTSLVHSR